MEQSLKLQPFIAILWVLVGLSQGVDMNGIPILGSYISSPGGSSLASMPCVQKLLPCQEYLKPMAADGPPAPSCCLPLKEMISDDSKCLCDIFNNADFFKNLNITQDDALRLPKACGANADVSVCKMGIERSFFSVLFIYNKSSRYSIIFNDCGLGFATYFFTFSIPFLYLCIFYVQVISRFLIFKDYYDI